MDGVSKIQVWIALLIGSLFSISFAQATLVLEHEAKVLGAKFRPSDVQVVYRTNMPVAAVVALARDPQNGEQVCPKERVPYEDGAGRFIVGVGVHPEAKQGTESTAGRYLHPKLSFVFEGARFG